MVEELVTAEEVGEALRVNRIALGWTQSELAKRARVSRQWLIKVEAGHPGAELGRLLSVLHALHLAVAFPRRQPPTAGEVDLDRFLAEGQP